MTDIKAAAAVEVVLKNGVTYTLPQILAPFATPVAMAARRNAIRGFNKLCHQDVANCQGTSHAH